MKRLILSAVIASATLTGALAQQNDQRLNKAITDNAYFQKAWKSAPSFRDLLKRRKAAVNQFRAIPTAALQPITIRAFATAEQRAGTRHVIIREHQYLNDSGYNNGGFDLGIGTPDHVIAAIAGDIIDSYVTQAAIKGLPSTRLPSISSRQGIRCRTGDWIIPSLLIRLLLTSNLRSYVSWPRKTHHFISSLYVPTR